ncbi:acyl-CoA dehydrogenase [Sphingobacterium sp. NPDC055431]
MLISEQIQIIKELQAEGIKNKALTKEQLDLVYQNNWFNLWVPKTLNGLEMSFPEGLDLLEELAYWDGGLAWTVTLCAGANMFAGFIQPEFAKSLWSDPKICLGGSGRVGGKAIDAGEYFVVSGYWNYATGAPHLTHFTFNAEIINNGEVLKNESGENLYFSFLVPKDDVLIHYDWDTIGLECTASHSFSFQDLKVPKENAFVLDPKAKQSNSTLFNIPFMPFAELTLLVNYVGMFKRFLDLCEKYYFEKSKDRHWGEKQSKTRFKQLDQLRTKFEGKVGQVKAYAVELWQNASEGKEVEADLYLKIGELSREIAKDVRMDCAEILPLLGIRAAQKENELNIVFRNLFTASQHSLLNVW